jgi:hypothetical protein
VSVTTLLDILAILMVAAGLTIGLWAFVGGFALCWGGIYVAVVSWLVSKRIDG